MQEGRCARLDPENLTTCAEQAAIAIATAELRRLAQDIDRAACLARAAIRPFMKATRYLDRNGDEFALARSASGAGELLDLLYVTSGALDDATARWA